MAGFAALCGFTGYEIGSSRNAGLLEILGLLALTGFFVAAIFAFASLRDAGNQKRIIAPLYASDLVGGCVGAVLASLVLAPLAGLPMTAFLLIGTAAYAALLL
jgi:hypothetical protein